MKNLDQILVVKNFRENRDLTPVTQVAQLFLEGSHELGLPEDMPLHCSLNHRLGRCMHLFEHGIQGVQFV